MRKLFVLALVSPYWADRVVEEARPANPAA